MAKQKKLYYEAVAHMLAWAEDDEIQDDTDILRKYFIQQQQRH